MLFDWLIPLLDDRPFKRNPEPARHGDDAPEPRKTEKEWAREDYAQGVPLDVPDTRERR